MLVHNFRRHHRLKSIAAVIGIHLLIGYILLTGLRVVTFSEAAERLTLLRVEQLAEPAPPPESEIAPDAEEEGASAPPDLRAEATPVAAPESAIVIPRPQEIIAAPDPHEGAAPSQGAAEQPGPGTGAGGAGDGTGRGADGRGPGGGGIAVRARHIAGEISRSDYPRSASAARAQGVVGANVDIGRDGRVTGCVIVQSSGNAELDAITCRLIEQRFRYEPARNAAGEPVPDTRGRRQRWCLGRSDCPAG